MDRLSITIAAQPGMTAKQIALLHPELAQPRLHIALRDARLRGLIRAERHGRTFHFFPADGTPDEPVREYATRTKGPTAKMRAELAALRAAFSTVLRGQEITLRFRSPAAAQAAYEVLEHD